MYCKLILGPHTVICQIMNIFYLVLSNLKFYLVVFYYIFSSIWLCSMFFVEVLEITVRTEVLSVREHKKFYLFRVHVQEEHVHFLDSSLLFCDLKCFVVNFTNSFVVMDITACDVNFMSNLWMHVSLFIILLIILLCGFCWLMSTGKSREIWLRRRYQGRDYP